MRHAKHEKHEWSTRRHFAERTTPENEEFCRSLAKIRRVVQDGSICVHEITGELRARLRFRSHSEVVTSGILAAFSLERFNARGADFSAVRVMRRAGSRLARRRA